MKQFYPPHLPTNRLRQTVASIATAILLIGLVSQSAWGQTTLINSDFEPTDPTGWTLVDATTNKWRIGTATNNGGTQGIYITNDNGVTNAYTNTATTYSHFYKSVTFPAGETAVILSFDWKGIGEHGASTSFDYIRVSLSTTAPTNAAMPATADQLPIAYNAQSGYTKAYVAIPASMATGTKNVIISWYNDSSAGTTAGAIDNLTLTSAVPAPISGTKAIPGDYASIGAAFAYLNANGVGAGGATFNVAAGTTFNENPSMLTATGTAANPILFQKNGSGTNPKIIGMGSGGFGPTSTNSTSSIGNAIIGIAGGDYITFDGIDVESVPYEVISTAIEYGYYVRNASATDGAQYVNIKNTTVAISRLNTNSRGIFQNASTTAAGFAATAASGANSYNTYKNLTIKNCYYGIYLLGTSGFPDINCEIGATSCTAFNTIGDPATPNDIGTGTSAAYGIRAANQSGVKIYYNNVRNVTASAAVDGIFLETFQGTSEVYNNTVRGIRNSSTTSTTAISGIAASHNTTGTHTARIYNNAISEVYSSYTGVASATRTIKGMFIRGTGGTSTQLYEIYNNSISIDGSASPNISSTCFEISTASGCAYDIKNNIFANFTAAQGATAKHSCIVSTSATAFGPAPTALNNNDYWIANDVGVSGFVGIGNTTTYATLANWQTGITTPATHDAASLSVDPVYVNNASDLHANTAQLNATGITLPAYLTADLACASRTDSDLGAYIINSCSSANGGTITPATASRCAGQTYTMTSTGADLGAGISYQWEISTTGGGVGFGSVVGGTGATTTSYTTAALTAGTYYYRLKVTCSSGPINGYSNELVLTVIANPTASILPTSSWLCDATPIALTASGGDTYAWSPAAGLDVTNAALVNASPTTITTYVVTVTNASGCTATASTLVGVSTLTTTASATPTSVCSGGSTQLDAAANNTITYITTSATYALQSTVGFTAGPFGDDIISSAIPLPFTFTYFGSAKSQIFINTNGQIGFNYTGTSTSQQRTAQTLPNATVPNDNISLCWADLNSTAGQITYGTVGTAPNRIFVIDFNAVPFFSGGGTVSGQIQLYETTHEIQIHLTSVTNSTVLKTLGIENSTGTIGYAGIGRNNANWFVGTPEAWRFTQANSILSYAWSENPATPVTLAATNIANPMANGITVNKTYTVTVTENTSGCSKTSSVAVTTGTPLSTTPTATPSTICAGATSTISADVMGGGAPYNYIWDNGMTTATLTVNPSSTTSYSVTVTDICLSTASGTVTVTVNPTPTASAGSNSPVCAGSVLNLTSSANIGDFYAWSGPSAYTSTDQNPTIAAAALSNAGTYTVTVSTAAGCAATASTAVTVNANPTITSTTATPATVCLGSSSTLAVLVGTSPTYCNSAFTSVTYEFITNVSLSGINNTSASNIGGPVDYTSQIANVTAGSSYDLSVTIDPDANDYIYAWIDWNQNGVLNDAGEAYTVIANTSLAGPHILSITVPTGALNGNTRMRIMCDYNNATPNPCRSATYGEAEDYTVNVTGGTDAYTYLWNDPTVATTASVSVSPTATTTYIVTVTNINGCTSTSSTTVTVSTPTAAINPTSAVLNCTTTSTVLTASGGGTYLWDDGSTDAARTVSSVGTYSVTVTNIDGCTATTSASVTSDTTPPSAGVSPASAVLSCATPTALLTASGGGTYLWDDGSTDAARTVSSAGTYSVVVTGANGCTASASASVTSDTTPPSAGVSPTSAVLSCATPTALLTASGGGTYLWNDGSTDVARTVSSAGTYSVVVTGANGCTASASASVTGSTTPPSASVSPASAVISCTTPTVTLTALGGGTYLWPKGVTTSTLLVGSSGTYTVTVTGANGCTATASATVTGSTTPPLLTLTPTSGVLSCTTTSLTLTASGTGTSYLWSTAATSPSISASSAGTYTVTATGANGCRTIKSATITSNTTPPTATITGATSVCAGSGTIMLTASSAGVAYNWSGPLGYTATSVTITRTSASTLMSGTYTVTITGSNGCTASASTNVTVSVCGSLTATTAVTNNTGLNNGTITVSAGGGTPCAGGTYNYAWSGVSSGTGTGVSPYLISGLATGWYYVTVTDCAGGSVVLTVYVASQTRTRSKTENSTLEGLTAYPNPTSDVTTIAFTSWSSEYVTVNVYATDGKQVATLFEGMTNAEADYALPLSVANIPAGVYVVQVLSQSGIRETLRIAVAK